MPNVLIKLHQYGIRHGFHVEQLTLERNETNSIKKTIFFVKVSKKTYIILGMILSSIIVAAFFSHFFENPQGPDLVITSFGHIFNGTTGHAVTYEMDLFNKGTSTAKNCTVSLSDGRPGSQPILSSPFNVFPTRTAIQIKITSGIYDERGTYQIQSLLGCVNTKVQSAWDAIQIT